MNGETAPSVPVTGSDMPNFTICEDAVTVVASQLPHAEAGWITTSRQGVVHVADAGEDYELFDHPALCALVEQAALWGCTTVRVIAGENHR